MRFRRGARLDPGQIRDIRGRSSGIGMGMPAIGTGGGIVGVIVVLLFMFLNNGGGSSSGFNIDPSVGENDDVAQECQTGEDANESQDCRIVAVVNSVQTYWDQAIPEYSEARTTLFTDQVSTGCGAASSAVGPFYCPPDQNVYVDLGFFGDLESRFGAEGGPFAEAYVLAHEYGHHVQNVLSARGDSIPMELQADCYAGVWAKNAVDTGFITELSDDDIRIALDAAAAVGDDRIQERTQGRVDPESWTHGSAEQRQRWFSNGFREGNPAACDTFGASEL